MKDYKALLKENSQEHLLKYIDIANDEQKEKLINEIENIDFEQLNRLYKTSKTMGDGAIDACLIEHVKFVDEYSLSDEKYNELKTIGENVIKSGHYAVATMAGGQGTRLGFNGPKGTFLLNIAPKAKYLFEIIADNLKEVNKKFGITLPWYIMTSTENNDSTVEFFKEHNYFEYPKKDIKFFKQGDLPLLDENGKLMINKKFEIREAADGNGSIYSSMKKAGILDDMKDRGVEWIFIGSVDNVLLNMCDPVLVGLTVSDGNEIGSKSIVKNDPKERVGVFCKKNGNPGVIEYSELPEAMAEERDENGELLYGEAHIMCNLYSLSALEKIAGKHLAYHSAHKKANYLDFNGNYITVDEPNAYKYEAFIFDGFEFFDNISVLRGKREIDFAPIKNAEGDNSPATAIELYNSFKNNVK